MKPYKRIPIQECGELLVPIPPALFSFVTPHPYEKVGAPYGNKSPFFLREGVLKRLIDAQRLLQARHLDWQIQIFDAYRPIAVQQYMVDYTFEETLRDRGLMLKTLTDNQRREILEQIYEFWAVPSHDPATPPPHSTGSAVDVTLVDGSDKPLNMGSAIDEMSPRSFPNHFAESDAPEQQQFHQHRQLLREVMLSAGFQQNPNEWWHFSLGDQMWAWLVNQEQVEGGAIARYGSV